MQGGPSKSRRPLIYSAPQENHSPSIQQLLSSCHVASENSHNASNRNVNDSVPPIPPSFQNSVVAQTEKFLELIPTEINEIISKLPEDSRKTIMFFMCNLDLMSKLHRDKMSQEFKHQLQEIENQNTHQQMKISMLKKENESLTKEIAIRDNIIETQIPLSTAKFNISTQTNFTPGTIPNKCTLKLNSCTQTPHKRSNKQIQTTTLTGFNVSDVVPKVCVHSDSQTSPVKTIDGSMQTDICHKKHVTSEFQCQVSTSNLPHMTQVTQTLSVKSVHFSNQANIMNNPKITKEVQCQVSLDGLPSPMQEKTKDTANSFIPKVNTIQPLKSTSRYQNTSNTTFFSPTKFFSNFNGNKQNQSPLNPVTIQNNFKSFKCAWCLEKKHDWTQCKQWNNWNLPQKQQALQILDNVKKGILHPTVVTKPHFHPQHKSPFNPTHVKINRENISKVQWEKQVKINENVKDAGLVKISSSYYVHKCSAVHQGVESSSLRRSRTTPKSE